MLPTGYLVDSLHRIFVGVRILLVGQCTINILTIKTQLLFVCCPELLEELVDATNFEFGMYEEHDKSRNKF